MVKHFGNGLQPLGEFSISRAHDVLRYLIKAEARGDKDGRARFRLTNKNLLSTIAMLYRAVRECRALRKRGGCIQYVDATFGVDADQLQV